MKGDDFKPARVNVYGTKDGIKVECEDEFIPVEIVEELCNAVASVVHDIEPKKSTSKAWARVAVIEAIIITLLCFYMVILR